MEYRAVLLFAFAAQQIILSSSLKLPKETPGPGSVLEASDGCLYQLVSLLPDNHTTDAAAPAMALLGLVSAPMGGYKPLYNEEQQGTVLDIVEAPPYNWSQELDGKPCKPSLRAHILPRTFKALSHPVVVSNNTSSELLHFTEIQHELEEQGLKVAELAGDNATKDAFAKMLGYAASSISGKVHMVVKDAEGFAHDQNCADAVAQSVASELHIPVEYVHVNLTVDENETEPGAKNSSLLQQHQELSSGKRVTASIEISLLEGIHMDLEAWTKYATAGSFNKEMTRQFRQASLNGTDHKPRVVDVTLNIERSSNPLAAKLTAQRGIGSQVAVAAEKGLKPWTDAMLNAATVRDQHAERGTTLAEAAFAAKERSQSLEVQARQWDALPGAHAKVQARKLHKKAKHFMAVATEDDKKAKDSFKMAKSIDDSLPAYQRQAQQGAYHEIAKVAADVQAPLPPLALTQKKNGGM